MSDARSNGVHGLILYKPFKVVVCAITLAAFLFTTVAQDFAWAVNTAPKSEPYSIPAPVAEFTPDNIAIPESLGTVKYSWSSSRKLSTMDQGLSTIIHIQDAHCNYYAQKRIAQILAYLNDKYGVDTINLEGGAKDYDLSIFTAIADKAKRERISDHFVKEGFVNGAEYYAINNPDKVKLWGIEDVGLYIENLKTYRNSLGHKEEVDKYIGSLNHILANLKRNIYSKELLELDTKYNEYKTEKIQFKDYLTYLVKIADQRAINVKQLSSLYLLKQAVAEEESIDFKKANDERDKLVDRLSKLLSKAELEKLVEKTVEFKAGKMSQEEFYAYLLKKAKLVGLAIGEFPDLQKYIVYISMYNAVDKLKIMDEMVALEDKIKESLFTGDEQRQLDKLSKTLALTKNLFNISLSKEDYKYYKDNERSFDTRNFISFIDKKAPLYKIQAKLDNDITRLDDYREAMAKFYEYSLKRDDAFMKNLVLARAEGPKQSHNPRVSVIITGGFHTDNLADLFKKKNISYISIIPNFKNEDGYDCPYFRILSGEKNIRLKAAVPTMAGSAMQVVSQATALYGVVENAGLPIGHAAMPQPEVPEAVKTEAVQTIQEEAITPPPAAPLPHVQVPYKSQILTQEQVTTLRKAVEKRLPHGIIGWEGDYRDIIIEEVISSAVEGLGPAVSFDERLSYVDNISKRIFVDSERNRTIWVNRLLPQLRKDVIKMSLEKENLKILLGKNFPTLEMVKNYSGQDIKKSGQMLKKLREGIPAIAEKTIDSALINRLGEGFAWRTDVGGAHILVTDLEDQVNRLFPGMRFTLKGRNFLYGNTIFVNKTKGLEEFRLIIAHELSHTRSVKSGNNAFSLLRLEDNVFESENSDAALSHFYLPDPRGGKYQGMKNAAGEWVKWRQDEYAQGGMELRWERMGELVTEERWTYPEAWNAAAIASGFAEQSHLPRQAAYDILRLNLSRQISPQDQEYFGIKDDHPLPLHQAALVVQEKYHALFDEMPPSAAGEQSGSIGKTIGRGLMLLIGTFLANIIGSSALLAGETVSDNAVQALPSTVQQIVAASGMPWGWIAVGVVVAIAIGWFILPRIWRAVRSTTKPSTEDHAPTAPGAPSAASTFTTLLNNAKDSLIVSVPMTFILTTTLLFAGWLAGSIHERRPISFFDIFAGPTQGVTRPAEESDIVSPKPKIDVAETSQTVLPGYRSQAQPGKTRTEKFPDNWNSSLINGEPDETGLAETAPWPGSGGGVETVEAFVGGPIRGRLIRNIRFNLNGNGETTAPSTLRVAGEGQPTDKTVFVYMKEARGRTTIVPLRHINGVVSQVEVSPVDEKGNKIEGVKIDARIKDGRIIEFDYEGRVEIIVTLSNYDRVDMEYQQAPLPEVELRDFPDDFAMSIIRNIRGMLRDSPALAGRFAKLVDVPGASLREKLDAVAKADFISPETKLQAIANVMNEYCRYNGTNAWMKHNGKSWGSTWDDIINSREKIRIICDTSSTMFALLCQRLGLQAGYVYKPALLKKNSHLVQSGIPHAMAVVKIGSRWHLVETTNLPVFEKGIIDGGMGSVFEGGLERGDGRANDLFNLMPVKTDNDVFVAESVKTSADSPGSMGAAETTLLIGIPVSLIGLLLIALAKSGKASFAGNAAALAILNGAFKSEKVFVLARVAQRAAESLSAEEIDQIIVSIRNGTPVDGKLLAKLSNVAHDLGVNVKSLAAMPPIALNNDQLIGLLEKARDALAKPSAEGQTEVSQPGTSEQGGLGKVIGRGLIILIGAFLANIISASTLLAGTEAGAIGNDAPGLLTQAVQQVMAYGPGLILGTVAVAAVWLVSSTISDKMKSPAGPVIFPTNGKQSKVKLTGQTRAGDIITVENDNRKFFNPAEVVDKKGKLICLFARCVAEGMATDVAHRSDIVKLLPVEGDKTGLRFIVDKDFIITNAEDPRVMQFKDGKLGMTFVRPEENGTKWHSYFVFVDGNGTRVSSEYKLGNPDVISKNAYLVELDDGRVALIDRANGNVKHPEVQIYMFANLDEALDAPASYWEETEHSVKSATALRIPSGAAHVGFNTIVGETVYRGERAYLAFTHIAKDGLTEKAKEYSTAVVLMKVNRKTHKFEFLGDPVEVPQPEQVNGEGDVRGVVYETAAFITGKGAKKTVVSYAGLNDSNIIRLEKPLSYFIEIYERGQRMARYKAADAARQAAAQARKEAVDRASRSAKGPAAKTSTATAATPKHPAPSAASAPKVETTILEPRDIEALAAEAPFNRGFYNTTAQEFNEINDNARSVGIGSAFRFRGDVDENVSLPLVVSRIGVIIHNRRTGVTLVAHASPAGIDNVLTEISSAVHDTEIGNSNDVEVIVAGGCVNSVIREDETAQDKLKKVDRILDNRKRVVDHLANNGFTNVRQIFPGQVDIALNLAFDRSGDKLHAAFSMVPAPDEEEVSGEKSANLGQPIDEYMQSLVSLSRQEAAEGQEGRAAKALSITKQIERIAVAIRSIDHDATIFDIIECIDALSIMFKTSNYKDMGREFKSVRDDLKSSIETIQQESIGGDLDLATALDGLKAIAAARDVMVKARNKIQNNPKIYNDDVKAEFKKALDILDNILNFSKNELKAGDVVSFELKELMEGAAEATKKGRALKYEGVKIDRDAFTVPDGTIINTNKIYLKAAVYNILKNAIHYAQDKPVRLAVSRIRAEDGKECVRIDIEDDGNGISAAKLNAIDPRTGRSVIFSLNEKERDGGTGLGLTLVRIFVEQTEGADVKVESRCKKEGHETDHGTKFSLLMPLVSTPQVPDKSAAALSSTSETTLPTSVMSPSFTSTETTLALPTSAQVTSSLPAKLTEHIKLLRARRDISDKEQYELAENDNMWFCNLFSDENGIELIPVARETVTAVTADDIKRGHIPKTNVQMGFVTMVETDNPYTLHTWGAGQCTVIAMQGKKGGKNVLILAHVPEPQSHLIDKMVPAIQKMGVTDIKGVVFIHPLTNLANDIEYKLRGSGLVVVKKKVGNVLQDTTDICVTQDGIVASRNETNSTNSIYTPKDLHTYLWSDLTPTFDPGKHFDWLSVLDTVPQYNQKHIPVEEILAKLGLATLSVAAEPVAGSVTMPAAALPSTTETILPAGVAPPSLTTTTTTQAARDLFPLTPEYLSALPLAAQAVTDLQEVKRLADALRTELMRDADQNGELASHMVSTTMGEQYKFGTIYLPNSLDTSRCLIVRSGRLDLVFFDTRERQYHEVYGQYRSDGPTYIYAIRNAEKGQVIGHGLLYRSENPESDDFGIAQFRYGVHNDFRGAGYGKEALALITAATARQAAVLFGENTHTGTLKWQVRPSDIPAGPKINDADNRTIKTFLREAGFSGKLEFDIGAVSKTSSVAHEPAAALSGSGLTIVERVRDKSVWKVKDVRTGQTWYLKLNNTRVMNKEMLGYEMARLAGANTPPVLKIKTIELQSDVRTALNDSFVRYGIDPNNAGSFAILTKDISAMTDEDLACKETSGLEEMLVFLALSGASDIGIGNWTTENIGGKNRFIVYDLASVLPEGSAQYAATHYERPMAKGWENIKDENFDNRLSHAVARVKAINDDRLLSAVRGIYVDTGEGDLQLELLKARKENLETNLINGLKNAKTSNLAVVFGSNGPAVDDIRAKIDEIIQRLLPEAKAPSVIEENGKNIFDTKPIEVSKITTDDQTEIVNNLKSAFAANGRPDAELAIDFFWEEIFRNVLRYGNHTSGENGPALVRVACYDSGENLSIVISNNTELSAEAAYKINEKLKTTSADIYEEESDNGDGDWGKVQFGAGVAIVNDFIRDRGGEGLVYKTGNGWTHVIFEIPKQAPAPQDERPDTADQINTLTSAAATTPITEWTLSLPKAWSGLLEEFPETDHDILTKTVAGILASNEASDVTEENIRSLAGNILAKISEQPKYTDYMKDMQRVLDNLAKFWKAMRKSGIDNMRVDRIVCYDGRIWVRTAEMGAEEPPVELKEGEMLVVVGGVVTEKKNIPPAEEKPTLQTPVATETSAAQDQITARKALVNRGFKTAGRGDIVKVLVGIDEGMDEKAVQEVIHAARAKLEAAGVRGDNVKVEQYKRVRGDIAKTRENCENKKMTMAQDLEKMRKAHEANTVTREEHDGLKYILVVFDDESGADFDTNKYNAGFQKYGDVYVVDVPDAYTDCNLGENKYPDIEYRAMLAMHIARSAARTTNESVAALKELFDGAVENKGDIVKIVDGKLIFLQPIMVTPIYKRLDEWKSAQKALGASV